MESALFNYQKPGWTYGRRPWRGPDRKGVETVEIALTIPLLALVTFSTIQLNHHWHKEKMLKLATYEAVKAGARKDGKSTDVKRVFQEHCKALGIRNAKITFQSSRFDSAKTGTRLWARSSAPVKSNRLGMPFLIPLSSDLSGGYVIYRKEGL